jgi:hypothetical protein
MFTIATRLPTEHLEGDTPRMANVTNQEHGGHAAASDLSLDLVPGLEDTGELRKEVHAKSPFARHVQRDGSPGSPRMYMLRTFQPSSAFVNTNVYTPDFAPGPVASLQRPD